MSDCNEQKPREFDKVDRALELRVIDWLQWYEFPHDPKNPNIVELALELIQKRKEENEQLRADLDMVILALQKIQDAKEFFIKWQDGMYVQMIDEQASKTIANLRRYSK